MKSQKKKERVGDGWVEKKWKRVATGKKPYNRPGKWPYGFIQTLVPSIQSSVSLVSNGVSGNIVSSQLANNRIYTPFCFTRYSYAAQQHKQYSSK